MVANRAGRVELQLWRDGVPITRSFLAPHQTHPDWHMQHRLPPAGPHLPDCTLVAVQLRSRMPIGADWWLTEVETTVDQYRLGSQTLALRFAAEPDPWPTAVQPLIVPLVNAEGRYDRFQTWYLTVRGDGSEEGRP